MSKNILSEKIMGDPICLMHPGEFLKRAYIEPLGLSHEKAARALNISQASLSRIVSGKASLTAQMAVRLSACFGNSASQWMAIQANYDIMSVNPDIVNEIKAIKDMG